MKISSFLLTVLSFSVLSDTRQLVPRAPLGRYGIEQDNAGGANWIHWSSYIPSASYGDENSTPLPLDTAFTNGMMIAAASEAYDQMIQAMGPDPRGKRNPTAMTVLEVSGELFFSSSIKRNGVGFRQTFPESCASVVLGRCSTSNGDGTQHRFGGNCGEPSAIHMFCLKNPGFKLVEGDPFPQPARIVTWGYQDNTLKVKAPCGPNDQPQWGCERFLNDLGIPEVPSDTPPEAVPTAWTFSWQSICLVDQPAAKRRMRRLNMVLRNETGFDSKSKFMV